MSLEISPISVEMTLSSRSPRCLAPCSVTLLSAVLSSHMLQHIFPLHAAKPIRDLKASVPINYHPNQSRGLWYRIICQIIANGWGQVPLCHRPYPHGNFCSGWALPALPSLLMESLCAPGLQSSRLLLWIANISILAWPVDNVKSWGLW